MTKEIKITFAPGSFESFDGTQEELDQLVAEIKEMIQDGSLFENSKPVDLDDLLESNDPEDQEMAEKLLRHFNDDKDFPRTLQ
jgi:hypothetical protein